MSKHEPTWKISFGKIVSSEGEVICTLPRRKNNNNANLICLAPALLPLLYTALDALVEHGDETTAPWITKQLEKHSL